LRSIPRFSNSTVLSFVPTLLLLLPSENLMNASLQQTFLSLSRFVVQGLFESSRRQYGSLLRQLAEVLSNNTLAWQHFRLLFLGSGPNLQLDSHQVLRERVDVVQDAPYLQFYEELSRNVALLPAFASDLYYEKKSSSSIGAALIAGTPLIANRTLLAAYSFLDEAAIYFLNDGESEVQMMESILRNFSFVKISATREQLRLLNVRLIDANIRVLQQILSSRR